jgi:glycogen debranching enzyme
VPEIHKQSKTVMVSEHWKLGKRYLHFATSIDCEGEEDVIPELLFTNNETNKVRLYGANQNDSMYVKDAFHEYIVDENQQAVNPRHSGTKSGAWFAFERGSGIPAGDYVVVRFKLTNKDPGDSELDEEEFDQLFDIREDEADDFYYNISPLPLADELRKIQRQAWAGMLWTKQFYHFVQSQWSTGDPNQPPPPPERANLRNSEWKHLHVDDILSLPDKWEYPFFAAWDTAFHCIPLAMIDPEFAKKQLDLMTREWYMHPNGQIPAYEWNFSDVNPPVHAWATFRIFKIERKIYGREDIDFLERVFQKLLLNFTWWVNRKDRDGKNVFEGGFLGLDNIGLFNRSEPLPTGGVLEQADSTGWMAFFSLQMLNIALELAKSRKVYEDIASKFFEHFIFIADAMSHRYGGGVEKPLWNDEDGFYYDAISWGGPWSQQLPVRSLVGLIPLYASLTLEPEILEKCPSFAKRLTWFVENRPDLSGRNMMASMRERGSKGRLLLSLVNQDRLLKLLDRMLDEDEFLSPYGIRSMSKYHEKNPFSMEVNGQKFSVEYVAGESNSGLFGGNSNWRGPIWFPTTFLLIESLQRFFLYYGKDFEVECPKGSGNYMNLAKVAENVQHRLINLFTRNSDHRRPYNGGDDLYDFNKEFDHILFHEFFDGDTGRGLGAKHQNGWTGLVAKLIYDVGLTLTSTAQTPVDSVSAADIFFDDVLPRRRLSRHDSSWLRRRNTSSSSSLRHHHKTPSASSVEDTEDAGVSEHIRQLLENYSIKHNFHEELETQYSEHK